MPRFPRSSLMLLMLLLCAASPRPLQAADVAFTGVLPNGALYHAPVVSMREARFSNLVRQQTDYSCGAAALATILRYAYHLDADETTVIERRARVIATLSRRSPPSRLSGPKFIDTAPLLSGP